MDPKQLLPLENAAQRSGILNEVLRVARHSSSINDHENAAPPPGTAASSTKSYEWPSYVWSVYDPALGRRLEAGEAVPGYASVSTRSENGCCCVRFGSSLAQTKRAERRGRRRANRQRQRAAADPVAPSLGGYWVVPQRISCSGVLTGADLDFRRARFLHPVTVIYANQLAGDFEIWVPRGVRVDCNGLGFRECVVEAEGGPRLELRGLSLFSAAAVFVDEDVPAVRIVSR